MPPSAQAVFLGRDGVLNEAAGVVSRPEDVIWRPGVFGALRALRAGGWRLVVVTNQPDIARGLVGPAQFDNLTSWMNAVLAVEGVAPDGVYHCPHLPDAPLAAWRCRCDCRKPMPGMLRRAARDLRLDLSASVMIGDEPADVGAGRAAGAAACIRLADALDLASSDVADPPADYTCASLEQAADWLLHLPRRLRA